MLRTLLCRQTFVGALCKQKQAAALKTSLKAFSSTFSSETSETLEDLDDNGIIFEADKVHRLHRPVLEREVVDIFRPQNGEVSSPFNPFSAGTDFRHQVDVWTC